MAKPSGASRTNAPKRFTGPEPMAIPHPIVLGAVFILPWLSENGKRIIVSVRPDNVKHKEVECEEQSVYHVADMLYDDLRLHAASVTDCGASPPPTRHIPLRLVSTREAS